jgi:predicted nucleic acid-binding protein
MDKVLIDTSAWIESFRPDGNREIRETVRWLLKDTLVLMPGIIRTELLRGTKSRKEYEHLAGLLDGLEYLAVQDIFWEKVARFSFELFRSGITVPLTDTYIALVAMDSKAKILHCDRHFDLIAGKVPLDILSPVSL